MSYPTEKLLDAALRDARDEGFSEGFDRAREAAARVCDERALINVQAGVQISALALQQVAVRIRALEPESNK